ncbi:BolA family transcriptional regulator [Pleomorphomonas diazotrophica]|uniref:BolA family transcriptional regulator n=1 Tax=Pleomorphomonas diazotrophica TaxID=1166257 RepID=A0A1I4RPC1_9HYPH|nr:BolA family protein [Pleomorphomonas diazotrophica]PKR88144.1 BolA family transcriptional regulator [Pleomorphomonas diazotrophica]SFM54009.1 BolA protein [Pleomorphomonas diazotrophica]
MASLTPPASTRKSRIEAALLAELSPSHLSVIDDSERHRGHGGWREGGETHYAVEVVSAIFEGKSRLARQRLVMGALKAEFDSGLHALSVSARAPGE